MKALDRGNRSLEILADRVTNLLHGDSSRSPVLAILCSLLAGAALAIALVLGPASSGSEPVVTGSILFAFGFGWALMTVLSMRFSAQRQAWMAVPATFLGSIGLGLVVVQPNPAVMDVLGWIWPPALAILAIWMFGQVRSRLRGRARWLVGPLVATLLLLAVGGGLATVSAATQSPAQLTNGRMIGVGGHRLYVECSGTGGPAVILQAGLGASSSSWELIAPAVSAATTVCVYDRAGHGLSDEAAAPQDGIALATDLHTLLARAGVAGPYILAGHSSGGVYVRAFADRYPDQVAGMVLLDSQPGDAFTALPEYPRFYQALRAVAVLSPSLARVGLAGPLLGLSVEESTPASARGARDEILALPAALQQSQALTSLGDRPLIVVTAGTGQQTGWLAAQDEMTNLSSASLHRVITAATHNSLISGADTAVSSEAILDVLEAIRSGSAPQ